MMIIARFFNSAIKTAIFLILARAAKSEEASRRLGRDFLETLHFTDNITFTTALNNTGSSDFYYPSRSWDSPFPLIVLLQGGLVDKSLYKDFAESLAIRGYVVVVPNHFVIAGGPPGIPLPPGGYPPALYSSRYAPGDVLKDVKVRISDPSSPLYDIVDIDNMGVAGHSFGGVISLHSISSTCNTVPLICPPSPPYEIPPELKAAVVFGTSLVSPFGGPPQDIDNQVPSFFIQGSDDGLSTVDELAISYENIEVPKGWIELEGANHWMMTNVQNPPTNSPDPNPQPLSQSKGIHESARWSAVIFDLYLKKREFSSKLLLGMLAILTRVGNGPVSLEEFDV